MDPIRQFGRLLVMPVPAEVEKDMDRGCVEGIGSVSFAMLVVEVLAALVFLIMSVGLGSGAWDNVASSLTCGLLNAGSYFAARRMLRLGKLSHARVTVLSVAFFAILSGWAIVASRYHYAMGEQMISFYMVQLIMASFLVLRPWLSILLVGGAFTTLYATLVATDGAAHADTFNFFLFAVVTAAGMTARFHVERMSSQRQVDLHYIGTHDELTGLLNRKSLHEDMPLWCGKEVAMVMADVNHFKTLNDTHGHLVGDAVLREAAAQLGHVWPEARIYRFGGDEFLVVEELNEESAVSFEQYSFDCDEGNGTYLRITLSAGRVVGTPGSSEEVRELIAHADQELYRVKRAYHSGR